MEKKVKNIGELMSYKDIIEILVRYDVIHREFILNRKLKNQNKKERGGFHDPEDNKIFIDTKQSLRSKRYAVIHELRHAYYSLKGKDDTEKKVEKETTILYNHLYNPKQ